MTLRGVHPVASSAAPAIGVKLRASRQRQGLTIDQLAEATGLTKGFLSRVERDLTSPSVATLASICQVLSLPIGFLFEEPVLHVIAAENAPAVNFGGHRVRDRLITPRGERRLQLIHSVVQAGGGGGHDLYTVNCEVEVVHVVSGHITVDFTASALDLHTDDTLTIPGTEPHTWRAHENSVLIWTLVPAPWSGSSSAGQ